MTRTTVIVVNYHGSSDTRNCINSLLECRIKPHLYVVDNTPHEVGLEEIVKTYPGTKLIQSPENVGFGRANNFAIQKVLDDKGTEFIFLLNNDAAIDPDTLEKLEHAMDEHPEAGIVTPKIVVAEDPELLWYGGGDIDWFRGGGKINGYMGSANQGVACKDRFVDFASGCAMLVRAEVFKDVGFFDPRFFMYEEDVNFCIRARMKGWVIWYESSAIVRHVMQGSLRLHNEKYYCPLSHKNASLEFYLYNIVKNRIINGLELSRGMERVKFFIGYPAFLLKKSIQYIVFFRIRPVFVIFRALRDGINLSEKY